MNIIEDGLYAHDGFAYGPLAEAVLRRTADASRRLERIQEDPAALTDAELHDGVRRILRQVTQREPLVDQVSSIASQIRQGTRYDWPVEGRLAIA
ncbi:hypothetical protein [Streptomyces sp. NPDC003688]